MLTNKNKKTVLVAGTFDLIHPGHLNFFKQAKKLGDKLFIIVARDQTVVKVKGVWPKYNERTRLRNIKRLGLADRALLGQLNDPFKTAIKLNPDIIALGYDQKTFTEGLAQELAKRFCYPKIVRLKAFKPEQYKSSKLKG